MKLKIEVNQKDIDNASDGQGHRCYICPIANALKRITGVRWGVGAVEVWPYWAKYADWMSDEIYRQFIHNMATILLPQEAANFVQQFDEETVGFPFSLTVKPFLFELEVPDWMIVN